MYMKQIQLLRNILLLIFFFLCQISFSQGFKIKEFKQNINDGSAFHAPMDEEGHPCGLIKVRTDNNDLKFNGDIVGNVENKMNEYWIYLSPKSRHLKVIHPNFMPLVIQFSEYGVNISPKATYILTLEEIKFKKEKTGVTIVVKPEDADLSIDEIIVEMKSGNGFYQLYLPKGEHVCKISKPGYRSNVQIVQTGKTQQNLDIELESVLAELDINCKTATAELYIDGEFKGNGSWNGNLLAGEHKIEARQKNHNSLYKTVILEEKESKRISLSALERSKAIIRIETFPSNIPVIFDGKIKKISPFETEVETGIHVVSIDTYGCIPYRSEIVVEDNKDNNIKIQMEYKSEDYRLAYEGNKDIIKKLIIDFIDRAYNKFNDDPESDEDEALFWGERYPVPEELLSKEGGLSDEDYYDFWIQTSCGCGKPEKALKFLTVAKRKVEEGSFTGRFWDIMSKEYFKFRYHNYIELIGNSYLKLNKCDEAINLYKQYLKTFEGEKLEPIDIKFVNIIKEKLRKLQ